MLRRVGRKFLASAALARGVNKKHFSGTAEAGALPKSSRAFARPGRVGDPSLHNPRHGRVGDPSLHKPRHGRVGDPSLHNHRDPSLHGQARGRGDRPYVDRSAATSGNRAGRFAIFKVVFVGHIQSLGFILSVYDPQSSWAAIPRERGLARGVNKRRFSGTAEAGTPPRNCRALLGLDGSETRPHTGGWIVSLLSRKTCGT